MALMEQCTEQARTTEGRSNPVNGRKLRVLAIDDNDEFRQVVKALMESNGYEVETAGSPVKALDVFRTTKTPFDLVLLDYYMPQLDGGQTCEWLRKFNPGVKVIICSGADEFHLRQFQTKHGVDGYIHKPFRLEEAEFVIRRVLSQPARG